VAMEVQHVAVRGTRDDVDRCGFKGQAILVIEEQPDAARNLQSALERALAAKSCWRGSSGSARAVWSVRFLLGQSPWPVSLASLRDQSP
jgi:hypothetical protein